jgi:hypothetical protein
VKLSRVLGTLASATQGLLLSPLASLRVLSQVPAREQAAHFARAWPEPARGPGPSIASQNPLRKYFDDVKEGPGVWKWLHYFDLYHQHLQKFVGKKLNLVEVGVYSGGSMLMWRHYFGPDCQVHGVDIQPECRAYESDHIKIHIGDQADRGFWRRFRAEVPKVDVLIDDGGHMPHQQIITLEEMLPHIQPGGVFICEDIHAMGNGFTAYCNSLTNSLNATYLAPVNGVRAATGFQAHVRSITTYPFAVVIEKADVPMETLSEPKHGTEWQPFL